MRDLIWVNLIKMALILVKSDKYLVPRPPNCNVAEYMQESLGSHILSKDFTSIISHMVGPMSPSLRHQSKLYSRNTSLNASQIPQNLFPALLPPVGLIYQLLNLIHSLVIPFYPPPPTQI